MLKIENLSFRFDEKYLIKNFSFDANAGDIIHIKGASGSGKTSLLYILSNIIPHRIKGIIDGKVLYNGKNISSFSLPELSPKISLLMQEPDYQIFFPTVEQEIAFAPENLNLPREEIKKRIGYIISLLQIQNIKNEATSTLSFGQKKLVAIASLLALSPQVFLLDEPAAGLSNYNLNILETVILDLKEAGKIIFFSDHSGNLNHIANRRIQMEKIR